MRSKLGPPQRYRILRDSRKSLQFSTTSFERFEVKISREMSERVRREIQGGGEELSFATWLQQDTWQKRFRKYRHFSITRIWRSLISGQKVTKVPAKHAFFQSLRLDILKMQKWRCTECKELWERKVRIVWNFQGLRLVLQGSFLIFSTYTINGKLGPTQLLLMEQMAMYCIANYKHTISLSINGLYPGLKIWNFLLDIRILFSAEIILDKKMN